MCEPITMATVAGITAAASMAGTAMSISSQNDAAEAQANAANEAAKADYQQLEERNKEANDKAQLDAFERQRQTNRELSRMQVAFGEAGIVGTSPLHELANTMLQGSYDKGLIEENRENIAQQSIADAYAVGAQNRGRVNQAQSQVTNPFMETLKIGTEGVKGFGEGYSAASDFNTLFPGSGSPAKLSDFTPGSDAAKGFVGRM